VSEAKDYSTSELMIAAGSSELRDDQGVFGGLGIPQLAVSLAQRPHAPRIGVLNEIGVVDPPLLELGVGNAAPRHWVNCTSFTSFLDVVGMLLHRGLVDIGFLGALEVDEYGNNNSSEVARDEGGLRRFGGGGGANDIASHAKNTILIIRHEKRKLVKQLVHNTSPGFLGGSDSRAKLGLPGGGPKRVLTDKAVFGFDEQHRLKLLSIHPGVSPDELRENTGFPLDVPSNLPLTPPPSEEEVRLIREELDPKKMYVGAF